MTMKDRVQELRRVPASELRANPKNWRRHPPSQEAALRGVLEDIGFADAVIARETDDGLELIDGHLRQEVMGDQVVPVLIVDVTEEEADKMLLTYDPLAMMAHADQDQLLNLLHDTQFASKAVNDMLEAVANGERLPMPDLTEPVEDPGPQKDRADELREKWQTERGQVWEVGRHQLMCGDCLVTLLDLPDIDVVVTDPPYAIMGSSTGAKNDTALITPFFRELWSHLQDVGPNDVYMCCDWRSYPTIDSESGGWAIKDVIIWDKGSGGLGQPYKRRHEFIVFARRATSDTKMFGLRTPGKRITDDDVWEFARVTEKSHNAEKPVGLFRRCLENSSEFDGTVYDPFLGSGTTMVAAEQLGRICYGMEIEPKYVAVTLERMAGMGLEPKLAGG